LGLARTKLEITPTAHRLASHFGETVHITAWERGRVLYVASQRPPGGVAAPAEPVAAQLTPPGTMLLAERAGGAGSGLEPGELERTRRRGYAVGAQRALEGVDCRPIPSALRRCRRSTGRSRGALAPVVHLVLVWHQHWRSQPSSPPTQASRRQRSHRPGTAHP